ncbi:hypothetical protein BDW75DRAFT_225717 [Aspergillus navahoensis]
MIVEDWRLGCSLRWSGCAPQDDVCSEDHYRWLLGIELFCIVILSFIRVFQPE